MFRDRTLPFGDRGSIRTPGLATMRLEGTSHVSIACKAELAGGRAFPGLGSRCLVVICMLSLASLTLLAVLDLKPRAELAQQAYLVLKALSAQPNVLTLQKERRQRVLALLGFKHPPPSRRAESNDTNRGMSFHEQHAQEKPINTTMHFVNNHDTNGSTHGFSTQNVHSKENVERAEQMYEALTRMVMEALGIGLVREASWIQPLRREELSLRHLAVLVELNERLRLVWEVAVSKELSTQHLHEERTSLAGSREDTRRAHSEKELSELSAEGANGTSPQGYYTDKNEIMVASSFQTLSKRGVDAIAREVGMTGKKQKSLHPNDQTLRESMIYPVTPPTRTPRVSKGEGPRKMGRDKNKDAKDLHTKSIGEHQRVSSHAKVVAASDFKKHPIKTMNSNVPKHKALSDSLNRKESSVASTPDNQEDINAIHIGIKDSLKKFEYFIDTNYPVNDDDTVTEEVSISKRQIQDISNSFSVLEGSLEPEHLHDDDDDDDDEHPPFVEDFNDDYDTISLSNQKSSIDQNFETKHENFTSQRQHLASLMNTPLLKMKAQEIHRSHRQHSVVPSPSFLPPFLDHAARAAVDAAPHHLAGAWFASMGFRVCVVSCLNASGWKKETAETTMGKSAEIFRGKFSMLYTLLHAVGCTQQVLETLVYLDNNDTFMTTHSESSQNISNKRKYTLRQGPNLSIRHSPWTWLWRCQVRAGAAYLRAVSTDLTASLWLRALLVTGAGFGAAIAPLALTHVIRWARGRAQSLFCHTIQLSKERHHTEELLHQMLPQSVAAELRTYGHVTAQSYEKVSIFFSDIVGFTTLAAHCSPLQVVAMLNRLYMCFDTRIESYDVYKVETIGDAYMVASGLPERNGDAHAHEIAKMALDLITAVRQVPIPHSPNERLQMRVGAHSGPCVAGVVGHKMPRYCLFGDTVNTASRMESSSLPQKIQISAAMLQELSSDPGYHIEYRGEIDVKGKGPMRTYWLLGHRDYSVENDSLVCKLRPMHRNEDSVLNEQSRALQAGTRTGFEESAEGVFLKRNTQTSVAVIEAASGMSRNRNNLVGPSQEEEDERNTHLPGQVT